MIPSFASSPVYDMSTGIYYATGATAVIPTPAYELIPHRVFVGGFPASTTELELREHFEQFFTIKEVKVIRSADGVSKGYGFITFDTDDEADTVRGMSPEKLEFKGRKLNLGPALRLADYAIATPTGLVQSPTYGYTYSFPPQPPFVMVNTPQAYVYTPGSPVPQAMIYPVAAPANTNTEQQPANAGANGAAIATTPDGSPTRNQASAPNAEVVVPVAAKLPATPPATAASSSVSVVTAPVPVQQPQPCIQYPVYLQPQGPPTPVTPTVVAHPRGSPTNVYNSHMPSVPSGPYFSTPDGHGVPYQQTFYYNNTPMAAAGDAANMQMMYGNGAPPAAAPVYGAAEYTSPPTQQLPHDSPPIAQGIFTPSPHHGGTPQVVYEEGSTDPWNTGLKREFEDPPSNRKDNQRKSIMFCDDAVNVKAALKESSRDRAEDSPSETLRAQTTPPESPQF
ncbi:RRM domain-containing protein [Trichostrongylus colubriformis]|uniref:RRM domain-containing protein n=1 Tax=Trichostrongylus colubriformis TaxID=6319 RepID=A0AAN8J3F2_TRICO